MRLWYERGDVSELQTLPGTAIVCLDTETTGLSPRTDEVLQIAIVRGDGTALMNRRVRPERKRSWPSAERVHGITPAMVDGQPTLASMAREVEKNLEGAEFLVGFNISFDLAFLRSAGIEARFARYFDVMWELAPITGRWNAEHGSYDFPSLTRCAERYGYRFQGHDALEDARATLHCFRAMLGRGAEKSGRALDAAYLDLVSRHS